MKTLFILLFSMTTSGAFAKDLSLPVSVKERLRVAMWYEGIKEFRKRKLSKRVENYYPEELSKPFQQF